VSRQAYQRSGLLGHLGPVRLAGDGDATSPPELEQSLVPQATEGTKHGVGIHTHHGREVARGRESFTGLGLAFCDRTPDCRGGLVVQRNGAGLIQLEVADGASYGSSIDQEFARGLQPWNTSV
jgi:hypothetical protein